MLNEFLQSLEAEDVFGVPTFVRGLREAHLLELGVIPQVPANLLQLKEFILNRSGHLAVSSDESLQPSEHPEEKIEGIPGGRNCSSMLRRRNLEILRALAVNLCHRYRKGKANQLPFV